MKSLKYLLLCVLLIGSADLNAQTARLFGTRRLVLDNNDLITANNVYFVDNTGSLGINNVGLITGTFPNINSLVTLLAGAKTTNLMIDGGATWGLDILNTNNSIRASGRSIFGDNLLADNAIFNTGTGSVSINGAAGRTDNLVIVNGVADATVANFAADAVWDSRINGDQIVTGIQKIGGSIWLDGNSATHQIVTDNPLNVGTKNANTISLVTTNTPRLFIDGAGNTTITGNLSLTGIGAPALPAPFMQVLYLDPSNQIKQTPPGVNVVTGIGTVNTIPMWTPDVYKSGNSIMTQTANTGINITPGIATTNNVLVVNGVADATNANVAADAVWDARINGDLLVTGLQKIGGSLWLDGNSATHSILADNPLNIGTKVGANPLTLSSNGIVRTTIDASGNTTIAGGNTTINGGGTLTANVGATTFNGGGNFTINGNNTTINEGGGQFAVNGTGAGFAAKISTSNMMGLEVHCNGQTGTGLNSNTHFVDFFDASSANARGSIQGQDNAEYFADPINIANDAINAANIVVAAAELIAAAASAATIVGIPEGVGFAAQAVGIAVQIAQFAIITGIETSQLGVTYGSSAGDYAEYLKREDPSTKLYPGDIVGVKNGKISKNTEGAQSIFSVSLAPIVLGNVPPKGHEADYNKVGFLGQVPVKVRGTVNAGDFIIASGLNDGIGTAVSAEMITPEQFTMVVGRAWDASEKTGLKYVKVAVGLNAKAISEILSHEKAEIDALKKEVSELRKTNAEVTAMKMKLERIEKYLSQPEHVKEVIYNKN
ncbi:MAG: hypothetical protein ABI778_00810 [Ignavibacteriota bacterium]